MVYIKNISRIQCFLSVATDQQSKDLTSLCVGYMAELVAKRLVAVKGSHGDSNGKESALEDRGNTQDSPNHQPIKITTLTT